MANAIYNDYNDVKSNLFNEAKWLEKGRNIMSNINTFEKIDRYLLDTINKFKEIDDPKKDKILWVEPSLLGTSERTNDYIKTIKEKTKVYNRDFELNLENENEKEEKKGDPGLLMDIMFNKEILESRRREIENLRKMAGMIKDDMEYKGLKPTEEQQKVFDKIDNLNAQNVNNVNNNLEKPKEIDKEEKNIKPKKKKKCIIF